MKINLKCLVCEGTTFSTGALHSFGASQAYHLKRRSWFNWTQTKAISFMCVACGHIQLFGDLSQDFEFEEAP